MNKIAFDRLEPIQQAQLLHFYPEFGFTSYITCQRCGGQVLSNYGELSCLQCEAKHDRFGNWIRPRIGAPLVFEGQHQKSQKR